MLPSRRVIIWRVRVVGEERPQRLADLALVVVQQELHLLRVVEGLLVRRDGQQPRRGVRQVGGAGLRAGGVAGRLGLGLRPAVRALGATASNTVPPSGALTRLAENSSAVTGRSRPARRSTSLSSLVTLVEGRVALGGEDRVDRLAVLHGDDRQHGLAAEELLVGDVVLVDHVVLVQVAVLAGGELELGDARSR